MAVPSAESSAVRMVECSVAYLAASRVVLTVAWKADSMAAQRVDWMVAQLADSTVE